MNGFGLIKMSRPKGEYEQELRVTLGRVYDPKVGRFLSPDPVLHDAGNTQNLNRYSYVLNNPLKYTDPSGYTYRAQAVTFKGRQNPDGSYGDFGGGGGSVFPKMGTIFNADGSFKEIGPSFEDLYIEGPTGNWVRKSDLQKDVVVRYISKDAYVSVGSQRYYKGSTLHLVREPLNVITTVKDHSFEIYAEYSFTLGFQIGANINYGVPILMGKLKGPSLSYKIKPYIKYSKKDGWSFDIKIKKNQTKKGASWSVPFNSGTAEQIYDIDSHPDIYNISSERTRGLETISTNMNWDGTITEQTFFDFKFGGGVNLLIFGSEVSYGIKGN